MPDDLQLKGEKLQLWNELVAMILEWEDSTETAGDLARKIIVRTAAIEAVESGEVPTR